MFYAYVFNKFNSPVFQCTNEEFHLVWGELIEKGFLTNTGEVTKDVKRVIISNNHVIVEIYD